MEFLEFLGVAATFVLSGVGVYAGIRLVHVWTRRLMDDRSEPVSAELEERVDFAERILAKVPEQLAEGGDAK